MKASPSEPTGPYVRESVRCPSEAKPSGGQAKWKPGVKGCEGIEFMKVQKSEGVVRKPDIQVEAKAKRKPDVQVEAKSKRKSDVQAKERCS